MPQLDFFTLLFQFKSFFIFFVLLYMFFLFFFIPRLHLIISLRRSQVLNLLSYYNFLKIVTYHSFYMQCFFLKSNISFLNDIFNSFFSKFLGSKFSFSNFLFFSKKI